MAERRFGKKDFAAIADTVIEAHRERRDTPARRDRERVWKEIDRQRAMRPNLAHKCDDQGTAIANLQWLPEIELPLQAEALEVLTADAQSLLFPAAGPWFSAQAETSDEYLRRVDMTSLIAGDENEVPSKITQDNVDQLVRALIEHWHRQYTFGTVVDHITAEAFSYGLGVGRVAMVKRSQLTNAQGGIFRSDARFPALIARSIRNTYPDDSPAAVMNEGLVIQPMTIESRRLRLEDLRRAANTGDSSPESAIGGWMPAALAGLEPDKQGQVEILEAEGDLIVPRRTTEALLLANAVVWVAVGGGQKPQSRVVRLRWREGPDSSYLWFPYHTEDLRCAYPTSPLIKGWPLQMAATNVLLSLLITAQLNALPPVRYDRTDPEFAAKGGPMIFPGARWGTLGAVDTVPIGNPQALLATYVGLLQQYENVTGISPARRGAQTLSHTTAYAKNAELARGASRTVDFVKAILKGPMTRLLELEYRLGRPKVRNERFPIVSYGGYVEVSADQLPERVHFEAYGAGTPADEQAQRDRRLASLQMAIQIDLMAKQAGQDTGLDLAAVQNQILREGGWNDVDVFFRGAGMPAPIAGTSGLARDLGAGVGAGPALAAVPAVGEAA